MTLSGGPLKLIRKFALFSDELRNSDQGRTIATMALAVVERADPDQADLFLTELVILGFIPWNEPRP